MQVCDQCKSEIKIVYICDKCGGKFCREHKKPENHNCIRTHENHYINEQENNLKALEPELEINKKDDKSPEKQITPTITSLENLDTEKIEKKKKQIKSIYIIILLIISTIGNGFLVIKYNDYTKLSLNYIGLYDSTKKVNAYYENLTTQYSELREEYDQLRKLYTNLVESNADFQDEYNKIINYEKEIQLVYKKTITIQPKGNYSEIFSIPFSGFIDVSYNSTGEVYTWIGSSQIENCYYSRNPQFPKTAVTQNFTIPVLPDLMIYFANPDRSNTIQITFTINFTY